MSIKRGVSLYSYQQEEFFRRMTWRDQLREVATQLGGATGIEIISETTIPQYPLPPESFYHEWNNEMARWGLTAVTYDAFLDTLQFRDHVMNYDEAAERLKTDLRIAKRMGFKNVRVITGTRPEVIWKALPLAEELDVRITEEIHTPSTLKPTDHFWGEAVGRVIAYVQKTGTKHYGIQPDMGIFQNKPCRVSLAHMLRLTHSREDADAISLEIINAFDELDEDAFKKYIEDEYSDIASSRMNRILFGWTTADPEDLFSLMPYIYCVHGKFYEMTEIPGKPGQYEERCIMYPKVIQILKDCGYDGYINSEFEGQRFQQDMGDEFLADEIEQVRRHHEMLKRLIGE